MKNASSCSRLERNAPETSLPGWHESKVNGLMSASKRSTRWEMENSRSETRYVFKREFFWGASLRMKLLWNFMWGV
jgi:hypothetical protein